jgi:DNA primase
MSGDTMGLIPKETVDRIIQSSDIVDVISEFVSLKRTGRGYSGVCPFHNDKGPSLSVSQDKQLYHCFGCGASGNVVGFIMQIRNMDYVDAIRYLADRSNIKIEEKEYSPEEKKKEDIKEAIYEINILAARKFFANLYKNVNALEYFKNRGIDDKTLKRFGLGFSTSEWEDLYRFLKSKNYSDELILQAGLVIPKKKTSGYFDRFRNRAMFPVFDVKGRVIGFGGRVMDNSKPKYLNSPETPVFEKGTNLYGLNFVIKSGLPQYIIVVEGYMDCISLHQYGITNAVASLGTALTIEQSRLLKRYSKDIYICYDADSAGQTATLRGLEILESTGCNVKVIMIPDGKDPDEFLKKNGRDSFLELIKKAMSVAEYRISKAREGKNLRDVKQEASFVEECALILSKLNSEIEIQAYASRIYDDTGIQMDTILGRVRKIKSNNNVNRNNNENIRNNNTSGKLYNLEPAYKKAERGLLRLALRNKACFEYIKTSLKPEDFITECYKISAALIYDSLDNGKEIHPNDLLSQLTEGNDIRDVSLIFESENSVVTDDRVIIDDYIRAINKFNIETRIKELTIAIKSCEKNGDVVTSAELSQELGRLVKQLGR